MKSSEFFQSYWKKVQFCGSYSRKRFKSLRRIEKKVQFFASFLTKFVLNSLSHILEIRFNFFDWLKKNSILWVMLENKKGSILRVILKRGVRFCGWKEGFNSVSLFRFKKNLILWVILKKIQFFESYSKRGSILWVIKRSSILWVIILKREVQFCEPCKKRFNSLSHTKRGRFNSFESCSKKSILWVIFKKKVQFYES